MTSSRTDSGAVQVTGGAPGAGPAPGDKKALGRKPAWRRHLSFENIGIVYVLIAIIIIFSIWAPDTFPTWATVKSILNQNAVAGMIALSLVIPLSARIFDLSVGSLMGLCNVLVAWLLVNKGVAIAPAIALTILAGLMLGV